MGGIRPVLCRPQQVDCMLNLVNLSLYGNNLVSLGGKLEEGNKTKRKDVLPTIYLQAGFDIIDVSLC